MPYLRRDFLVPVALEETFVAELWFAGTLGVESEEAGAGRVRMRAYFEAARGGVGAPAAAAAAAGRAAGWSAGWSAHGVLALGEELLPETDWLAAYREQAQPFTVGRRLLVDPREPGEEPPAVPAGRTLLRLPARAAFGTGSHESTALAVELLEEIEVRGRAVLDVGTGTGILALAALARGACRAVGFDVDPAAPFHARDNGRRNGLAPLLFAGRLAALGGARARASFDLALANLVAEQLLPELPLLVPLLRPGGAAVLSGILAERAEEVLARAAGLGFGEAGRRERGEWVALHLVLPG